MDRALVLTNHLNNISGSSIVPREISLTLANSRKVTVAANVLGCEEQLFDGVSNVEVISCPSQVNLHDYQFIWSQHFVLPLCKGFSRLSEFFGVLCCAHLSPFMPLELAPLSFTVPIGAKIFANSYETARKIRSTTRSCVPIQVFNNACPRSFYSKMPIQVVRDRPSKVLLVSNHPPRELIQAMYILKSNGVQITVFGERSKNYRVLTEADITDHDVIVSIGKTCQYSILGRRPVYCYDVFGGPGYITPENCKYALEYNFSGRCHRRRRSAEEIARDIFQNYLGAVNGVNALCEAHAEAFNIAHVLELAERSKSKLSLDTLDPLPLIETAKIIRDNYVKIHG